MVRGPAKPAKTFYDACGDVGGRRIDHRVVVREGNVAEELVVVVAIKRAPTTVVILHTEQPLNAAANRAFHAFGVGVLHALERHQHKRSVVDIGIKIIAKLERPAAGFRVLVLHLPVTRPKNLLGEHPVRGLHQRGMIRRQSCFFQGDHGNAGVPNWRDARLHANGVALFNFKPREFLDFPPGQRIVRAVSQGHQRKNRIHHRRIDRGKAFGPLDVIQHPGFRFA